MKTPVIINGANGKMGQLAVKTLSHHPDFTVVAELGRQHHLGEEIRKTGAKIVVDLTNAESVFTNASAIIEAGAHPVIGTSGLLKNQVQQLQKKCADKKLGGIIVPNFSIGAVLMMKYAQQIAQYFSEVEIIESHHAGKLDNPSGTAIRTAELISSAKSFQKPTHASARETIPGARGADYLGIPIHAVRLPGFVANQQVIFGGSGETLSIQHATIDRECFMPGIVLCCQKVLDLSELLYGMEHIL